MLFVLFSFRLNAQETAQDYYTLANKALEQKDYEQYSLHIRKADELRPNHPAIVPKVAEAWGLTGRRTRAILHHRF